MSELLQYGKTTIKIPEQMMLIKNGKETLQDVITKTGNLTTRNKEKSIKFETTKSNTISIKTVPIEIKENKIIKPVAEIKQKITNNEIKNEINKIENLIEDIIKEEEENVVKLLSKINEMIIGLEFKKNKDNQNLINESVKDLMFQIKTNTRIYENNIKKQKKDELNILDLLNSNKVEKNKKNIIQMLNDKTINFNDKKKFLKTLNIDDYYNYSFNELAEYTKLKDIKAGDFIELYINSEYKKVLLCCDGKTEKTLTFRKVKFDETEFLKQKQITPEETWKFYYVGNPSLDPKRQNVKIKNDDVLMYNNPFIYHTSIVM